jgi:hypothetical protein
MGKVKAQTPISSNFTDLLYGGLAKATVLVSPFGKLALPPVVYVVACLPDVFENIKLFFGVLRRAVH